MSAFRRVLIPAFLVPLTALWALAGFQCASAPAAGSGPPRDAAPPEARTAVARVDLPAAGDETAPPAAKDALEAIMAAYPGRFESVEPVDGDWTIAGDGIRFFWAGGRLLPASELPRLARRSPHPFYRYPAVQPPVPDYAAEAKTEIRSRIERREKSPPARPPGFFNYLWRAYDKRSAERRTQGLIVLGKPVRVSVAIVPALEAIDAEIARASRSDPALRAFVSSIRELSGFYWRTIADTGSLSFHSYGAAVDVIARNPGNRETYWLWARERDPDWFARPLSARLQPPPAFVAIFEKHGFVWGGKWFFYDTLHFEYRPEILILNGIPVEPPPAR